MGYATLGFDNGPSIKFRIDPQEVQWGFQVNTAVTNTIGGRVVQVMGATLSDMTITGLFGQDHSKGGDEGVSWRLAQRFGSRIRTLMEYQSRDATTHRKMHQTATFAYSPRGWKFRVYVKAFRDPDGGALTHKPEKFSHGYSLVLFIVQNDSDTLTKAGEENGVIDKARQSAINAYIGRISAGIGWKPTIYNGGFDTYYSGSMPTAVNPNGLSGDAGAPAPSNPVQSPPPANGSGGTPASTGATVATARGPARPGRTVTTKQPVI